MTIERPPGSGPAGARPTGLTPSQTIGPFFAYALTPEDYDFRPVFGPDVATPDAVGERVRLEGRVLDGDGEPVVDAMVEIWQADGEGHYATAPVPEGANAAFRGFGRAHVDPAGGFAFSTVKPGPVPGPDGALQAPHVNVAIFARGLLRRLFTRAYFEGEAGNASDPILSLVPEDRRATLLAIRTERDGTTAYRFDIRLQGEGETVFFQD